MSSVYGNSELSSQNSKYVIYVFNTYIVFYSRQLRISTPSLHLQAAPSHSCLWWQSDYIQCYHLVVVLPDGYYKSLYSVTIQQQLYQMATIYHNILLPFSSSSTKWLLYITILCYHLVAALPDGYYKSLYSATSQQQLYQTANIYHNRIKKVFYQKRHCLLLYMLSADLCQPATQRQRWQFL